MQRIGRVLREAREARNLTIQAVEEATKIRRKYLEALEGGREADLPGEVYLKGFLRSYGNYLGLDGAGLVEQYKQEQEAQSASQQPVGADARARKPEKPAAEQSQEGQRPAFTFAQVGLFEKMVKRAGLLVVLAAVAGGVIWAGWVIGGQIGKQAEPAAETPKPTTPQTTPPPQTKKPDPPAPPKVPEPAKVQMAAPIDGSISWTVPANEIRVKLKFEGTVWMQAVVDGKELPDEMVPSGQTREFKGSKNVQVRLGWADAVSVEVNGQSFGNPAKSGPWNWVFTAKP